jgi:hypothetical protein
MTSLKSTPCSGSVKRGTLLYLIKKHHLKCFVETGTYRGDTIAFLANEVAHIHTIELDHALNHAAKQRFAGYQHIHCWQGCSGTLLGKLIEECHGPILFWLDGHYSGGVTARGDEVSPILKEIAQLAQSQDAQQHVILIDDVRLFDGLDYPSLGETLDFIKQHLPQHVIAVHNDMIFVEPPSDASLLTDEALSLAYRFAPRKCISQNGAYQLQLGPNFDREAAWRAGFQDADCVSSVYANQSCRFGNSIQQWKNLLGVALNHGLRRIYLPGYWWMKQGAFTLECGIEVVNQADVIMSDDEVILCGEFFDLTSLQSFSSLPLSHAQAVQLLGVHSGIDGAREPLKQDHLVIHIRAGDIFTAKRIHPLYGQPPLAFYQNVLAAENWINVTLIAENDVNPVWQPLVAFCRERFLCDIRVGLDLQDDIEFMMRAQNVIAARGTFASGIACFTPHWRRVITFETPFNSWGNPQIVSETWKDIAGEYRRQILSSNWKNTSTQRELMLTYPTDAIQKQSHS